MASRTPNGLLKGMKSLYESREYADLTSKTASQELRVHKSVVCSQSSFFGKACKDEWQKEPDNAVVSLQDERDDVVFAMLLYLYLADYDDDTLDRPPYDAEHVPGPLEFNVLMFIAGDKYDIPELSQLANDKFCDQAKEVEQQVWSSDLLGAVHQICSNTLQMPAASTLRKTAVALTVRRARRLLSANTTEPNGVTLMDLIGKMPDFAEAIIGQLADTGEEEKPGTESRVCSNCCTMFHIRRSGDMGIWPCYCAYCKSAELGGT